MKYPDKDDCKNLTQVMKYIRYTIGTHLILGIYDTNTLRLYVDTKFGVHRNIKSHIWMMMNMGQGDDRIKFNQTEI